MNIYALYKGDDYLDMGTAEELAKRFDVEPNTIIFYSTPTYKRRVKNKDHNRLVVIRVEDD